MDSTVTSPTVATRTKGSASIGKGGAVVLVPVIKQEGRSKYIQIQCII